MSDPEWPRDRPLNVEMNDIQNSKSGQLAVVTVFLIEAPVETRTSWILGSLVPN